MRARRPSRSRPVRGLLVAVVLGCLAAGTFLAARPALAGDPTPARRPVPDYDGRPDPPPDAGEALLWVPRALLSPVHVLFEHGVRRPIRTLAVQAEKHRVFPLGWEWLTWDGGRAALLPTLYYEFGLNPNVGFLFFWDDLGVPGHRLKARGGIWFGDWHQVQVEDSWLSPDRRARWVIRGGWSSRPDHVFHGLGPDTPIGTESEFRMALAHASVATEARFAGMNRVSLEFGYRDATFGPGGERSIETRHDTRRIPGFDGYRVALGTVRLVLDTRRDDPWRTPGSGLRLEGGATLGAWPGGDGLRFARWSLEGAAFLDLTGQGHVLAARLHAAFAEPLGGGPIPFTELPELGGLEHMAGFLEGRFRGPSVIDLTVEYRYPIWAYLDGSIFVGAGNAFGPLLDGFHPKRLHLDWGVGIRSSLRREASIEVLLAWGTTRLDSGRLAIEKVHFVIGVNHGF